MFIVPRGSNNIRLLPMGCSSGNCIMFPLTLAVRGLEEPRISQELLTESVGPVHFP